MDDRNVIRDLIENWAVWRDAGDWEFSRPTTPIATCGFSGEQRLADLANALAAASQCAAGQPPPAARI